MIDFDAERANIRLTVCIITERERERVKLFEAQIVLSSMLGYPSDDYRGFPSEVKVKPHQFRGAGHSLSGVVRICSDRVDVPTTFEHSECVFEIGFAESIVIGNYDCSVRQRFRRRYLPDDQPGEMKLAQLDLARSFDSASSR
jgi:hypothetical protein